MRSAQFESAIFAERAARFAADPENSTGDPALDTAISHGETWLAEAKNLNLLSLYESRIQRLGKEHGRVAPPPDRAKAAVETAIAEAAALAQVAQSKGETPNLAEPFERRGIEFSAAEIARMIDRYRRLKEAQKFCGALKKVVRMAA